MAVLKQNEYKLLLWGDKNNFITALDTLTYKRILVA